MKYLELKERVESLEGKIQSARRRLKDKICINPKCITIGNDGKPREYCSSCVAINKIFLEEFGDDLI